MNIGGHIKAKGLLTKNKHTRCLPQEDQMGGFPTNTLIEENPLEEDNLVEDPLMEEGPLKEDTLVEDPLMEEDPWRRTPWQRTPWRTGTPKALKDQQDL